MTGLDWTILAAYIIMIGAPAFVAVRSGAGFLGLIDSA